MRNYSYHCVFDMCALDALKFARANGFQGIQLAVESPHLAFENYSKEQIESVRQFCDDNQMYVAIHGPDEVASLLVTDDSLWRGIKEYYKNLFDFSAAIKAPVITMHIGRLVGFKTAEVVERLIPEKDYPFYRSALQAHITELLSILPSGTILTIENVAFSSFVFECIEPFLDQNRLGLCWDTGKSSDEADIFYRRNLRFVRQVHLHDTIVVNGTRKGHQVIGTGSVDFRTYMEYAQNAPVIDYCIEVRPKEKALESLLNLHKIIL